MSQNLKLGIDIGLDASDATKNVARFEADFQKLLEGMGKAPGEIRAFHELRAAIDQGKASTEGLNAATRRLLDEYRQLRAQAQARDLLELVPHEELQKRIAAVKAAFQQLKDSGKLSQTELAQASLRMTEQIRELEKTTGNWTGAIMNAKAGLAGLAGAGAGLGYMVKEAVGFESAMADVKKVVEATPEEFAALTAEIRGMTRELPLTAKELAAIAAAGGQLGVANKDLGEFTRLAAQMSTAFNMSAEQAGEAVAKLSNVFGIPIPQIRSLGDAVNVLGNTTSATEAQIVDATVRTGGMAKQFGLAADQTAALAAAFISLGKQPEVAATGINALLSKLQTARVGSKEFQEGLQMLGITADDLAARVAAKPQQALLEFLHTIEKLDRQSRAEALTKLFGQEYQDDISALVGNLRVYEQTLGSVTDKSKVAGSMTREFAARMETAEAQLGLLKNALMDVALSIGTAVLPALKSAVDGVKPLAEGLADFASAHPDIAALGTVLGVVAASVGTLEVAFKALRLAGVSSISEIHQTLTTSVGELGKMRTAVGVLEAAFVGWEVGKLLSERFAVVREAGVSLVAGLVKGAEHVRYAWDVAMAAFTSDTVEAATRRHEERLRVMERTFQELFDEAAKGTQKVAAATNEAGAAAQKAAQAAEEGATKAQSAGKKTSEVLKEQEEEAKRLEEALRYFGPAAEQAFSGVSKQASEASSQFANLIQGIRENGASAEQVASVFDKVWPAALEKATDTKDLEHFRTTLQLLADSGDLTAAQLDKGLGLVAKRVAEISAGGPAAVDWLKRIHEEAERGYAAEREQARAFAAEQDAAQAASQRGMEQAKVAGDEGASAWDNLQTSARMAREAVEQTSQSVSESFPELAKASQEARDEFARMVDAANVAAQKAAADFSFLGDRITSVREIAEGVTAEFNRQAGEVARLTARIEDGTLSLGDAEAAAEEAAESFNLLGEEQLRPLRQALADAARRAAELGDEARSTLSDLQDELDQMNRNQAAIEQRRYESRKGDLEGKLREAEAQKNSKAAQDLRDSLALLNQIHRKKMDDLAAEAAAEKAEAARKSQEAKQERLDAERAREGLSAPRSDAYAREEASRTRTGEFAPSSRTVRLVSQNGSAAVVPEDQLDSILRILADHGLRAV